VLLLLISCFLQQRWFNAALRMETARSAPPLHGAAAAHGKFAYVPHDAICMSLVHGLRLRIRHVGCAFAGL
jgi:hypothetical protein